MKKKLGIMTVLIAVATLIVSPMVMANSCPIGKDNCPHQSCSVKKGDDYQCPVTGKFMKKAHFFMENSDEIGLSDEQVATIKSLKREVKKAYLRQCAEMKVGMMDMEALLSEEKVNVDALNTMIDQQSAAFASSAKSTIASYEKLKGTLTAEQMAKAKAVWKKK